MGYCLPLDDPSNVWAFCASLPLAYVFAILFGITTCVHVVQAIIYRKFYSVVVIMSGLWQTGAFIFRVLSIRDPTDSNKHSGWFLLILVAPLWTNAYVYMVMGRMVYNFTPEHKVFGIKAWRFGLLFVTLDIFCFFIQMGGASLASQEGVSKNFILLGIHIYMIGIGVQQFFVLLFLAIAIRFHRRVLSQPPSRPLKRALVLLYILYAVLFLITIRIIYRLIEYSSGIESSISHKEAFLYCLDSGPMLIALVLFNIVHPGSVMSGPEADFPSRKDRKRMKKEEREAKKAKKAELGDYEAFPLECGVVPAVHDQASLEYGAGPRTYDRSPEYGAGGLEHERIHLNIV